MRYDIDSLDNRDPQRIEQLARFTERFLQPYHRAEVRGVDRVPAGAALYVGNHSGGAWTADSFLFAVAVYRAHGIEAVPYGLGHELAIQVPLVHELFVPLGAVRASHENAERLFADDRKVMVYPGGDVDSMRPFRNRNRVVFGGRRGYIRLAIRAGVPIIPVVAAGSHSGFIVIDDLRWLARALRADRWMRSKVWPLVLSFPLGLTLGPLVPYVSLPTRILIEILEPVRFTRSGPAAASDETYVAACDAEVREGMQQTLTRLARDRAGR